MNINFIKNIVKKYICECYMIKRQKVISHNKFITFNILLNEFIYNDLIKFLIFIDFNNYKYFITFKNDFIYYFEIYYIRHKSEIFVIFLRFKIYLKFRDYRIYYIRFDNENEYIINVFFEYFILLNFNLNKFFDLK